MPSLPIKLHCSQHLLGTLSERKILEQCGLLIGHFKTPRRSRYERVPPRAQDYWKGFCTCCPNPETLKPIPRRKLFDFIPNLIPNLKIFLFVTKCPWGFVLSVTVRGNAFIAKQNRLSATARVFRTFAEVLGAKGLFKLHCSQHRRSGPL